MLKSYMLWAVIPCSLFKVNRHFGGTCRYHLQVEKWANQPTSPHSFWSTILKAFSIKPGSICSGSKKTSYGLIICLLVILYFHIISACQIFYLFLVYVFAIVSLSYVFYYAWLSSSQKEQQNIMSPSCEIKDKCDHFQIPMSIPRMYIVTC
jgi:hypothetical protein